MNARALHIDPHPRHADLRGVAVSYQLRRSSRRTIGFAIGPQGLVVSAPRMLEQAAIDAGLQEKAGWILKHLSRAKEHYAQRQQTQLHWHDGMSLPYLGQTLTVHVCWQSCGVHGLVPSAWPTATAPVSAQPGDDELVALPLNSASTHTNAQSCQVTVGLQSAHTRHAHAASTPPTADAKLMQLHLTRWLQHQAQQLFQQRCAFYAPILGVSPKRVINTQARTRWGSASADGTVRLNWRLIHLAPTLIDYVVVHELAHLHEMNHSSRFWAWVKRVLPDYEARRAALKKQNVLHW